MQNTRTFTGTGANTMAITSTGMSQHDDASEIKSFASKPAGGAIGEQAAVDTLLHAPSADLPLSPHEAMKKKELIDLAVERSGLKKRDVKPAVEAVLAVLGEALAEGRDINMRPMGKIKVTRMKKVRNGQVIGARIRQPEEVDISSRRPLAQSVEDR